MPVETGPCRFSQRQGNVDVAGSNLVTITSTAGNPTPPPPPPVPGGISHDEPLSGDDLYAAVMAFQSGAVNNAHQDSGSSNDVR
ncbi:hypothetical protein DBR45_10830 [Pseudomonas sp. HMWF031]|nr:hypothetical protein DBR45_10830 [Pseudomonas sp. HMWF031]